MRQASLLIDDLATDLLEEGEARLLVPDDDTQHGCRWGNTTRGRLCSAGARLGLKVTTTTEIYADGTRVMTATVIPLADR